MTQRDAEHDVLDAVARHLERDAPAMLATVVDVEGSAYRRAGAKMLVSPEQGRVGVITAGCVESEVQTLAQEVLTDGSPRLRRFDLSGDDETWGLGTGCNGVLDVLLEPVDDRLRPLIRAHRNDGSGTVLTVVQSEDDRLQVGERASFPSLAALPDEVSAAVRDRLGQTGLGDADATDPPDAGTIDPQTIRIETSRGHATLFVESIAPAPRLVIVGTGPDVRPVVDLATNVGFRVTVVGFRGAEATTDAFPDAHRVVSTSPRSLTDAVSCDEHTFAVVMTHNFVDDRLAVDELLRTSVPYVGLLGPEKRFEEMREAFAAEGRRLSADERDRLYTPVGLDLGGDTPSQVAHSIVAEVLAVRNGRAGGHLRATEEPIHARGPDPGQ